MSRVVTVLTVIAALMLLAPETEARGRKAAAEAYREGQELGNQGDLDGAIAKFQEAVQLNPRYDLAYLRLGLAYQLADRWPESLAAYRAALEHTRRHKDEAYEGLGGLYRRMGHLRMSAEAFKSAIAEARKIRREYPEGHYELALTYIEMREFDDAISELREALRINPKYLRARVRLANTLVVNDELDEAQELFEEMIERNPNDRAALYGRGLIEKRRDNRDEAREIFKRACDLGHRASCREAETRYRALH